jgi:hypothetical protein
MDLTPLENRASFSDVPLDMMVMKLLKEKFTVLKRLFTHAKCKRLSVVLDIVTNPSEFKVIIHERFQSIIIFISTKIEPSVSSKIESVPSSLLSFFFGGVQYFASIDSIKAGQPSPNELFTGRKKDQSTEFDFFWNWRCFDDELGGFLGMVWVSWKC